MSDQPVSLPAGFTMRPTTLDDAEAAAHIYTEAARAAGVEQTAQPEHIRKQWEQPNFDLAHSSRIVMDPDGKPVAIVSVHDEDPNPVVFYVGWEALPIPEYHALSLAMVAWGSERGKEAIGRCPPDARVCWGTSFLAGYAREMEVMKAVGLEPVRYFNHMRMDMGETPPVTVPLPAGISVRTLNYPDELPRMLEAQGDAWRDHYGHMDTPLEERLEAWERFIKGDKSFDPTLWFLAIDDASGEIAGMVLCAIEEPGDPAVSHVHIVATRRPWRGRGVASSVLRLAIHELWQRGKRAVALNVDDSSPTGANRLYENIGMHVERQYIRCEKELRPGVELLNRG